MTTPSFHTPLFTSKLLLLLLTIFVITGKTQGESCEALTDVNGETCTLNDLTDEALMTACTNINLEMEAVLAAEAEESGLEPKETYTHEDYVKGAALCLQIEEDLARMLEEDPDALLKMEREMMQNNPEVMLSTITEVFQSDPKLIDDLIEELKRDGEEIYEQLLNELGEGETFHDRPELVAGLVVHMLIQQGAGLHDLMDMSGEFDGDEEGDEEL